MTNSDGGANDYIHPDKLSDEQLLTMTKRLGLLIYQWDRSLPPVPDPIGARIQYAQLYKRRDILAVQNELDRLHAGFIAVRLKRSQV
jgi:hypothetical protein